jgi:hypothetical protein
LVSFYTDANNKALVYLTSVSQSNANTFGSCSINYYYNSQISNSIQKNDCTICQTGSFVTYTLPASQSQYTSTCSLAEAQNSASAYYNSTSQSYANTNGTCTTNYYYNTQISASVQKNDCSIYGTGSFSLVTIPTSQSVSTCSLSDAQSQAQTYFNSISQSWANLSGSCTTSGAGFKMRGRVGDSPIIGAGLYVDNEVGAVVATGQGEDVIRVAGASAVVEWMRQGKSPEQACKLVVEKINRIKKEKAKDIQVCFVAINKKGMVGAYALQKGFNFSVYNKEGNTLNDAGYLI